MQTKLHIVIFSKDRACQLDMLMTTIRTFVRIPHQVSVLYAYSMSEFATGYLRARKSHPEAHFVAELPGAFKPSLESVLKSAESPYLMTCVDDMVFRAVIQLSDGPFSVFARDRTVAAVSTRMGDHCIRCYPTNAPSKPPAKRDCIWYWHGQPGDWGYPMSLDGNVWRTSEFLDYIKDSHFNNPNELEVALCGSQHIPPKLSGYLFAPAFTIPNNRVQHQFKNRCEGGSAYELNQRYLSGETLDPSSYIGLVNSSCHYPAELNFSLK